MRDPETLLGRGKLYDLGGIPEAALGRVQSSLRPLADRGQRSGFAIVCCPTIESLPSVLARSLRLAR